jgi:hypothetical protein
MGTVVGSQAVETPPRRHDEKTAWAPELIVIGALVFAFGLLIGAGIAAQLGPPG